MFDLEEKMRIGRGNIARKNLSRNYLLPMGIISRWVLLLGLLFDLDVFGWLILVGFQE